MKGASNTLSARSCAAVWHPCSQMKGHETQALLAVARAQGVWLFDPEGNPYLDAISSWWVNLFGHAHPHLNAALIDQLGALSHVMLAGCTHEPVVALSERLAQLTGLGHAFYASDGAAATEIALKMSAHYWRNQARPEKCHFVGVANGYHGETIGALSVTDMALFRRAYGPLVRMSATVPSPDARLAAEGKSALEHAYDCAQALQQYLEQHHAQTAAFILEPVVQCAAGMAMHHPHYVHQARLLCDRYNVHLIADEIAVGFGRTGPLFAHQAAAVRPDFICLSKGLTGGTLALSVVLCTDAVFDAFYDDTVARGFLHSHSYTGNALACRAALASLDIFEQQDWLLHNQRTAAFLSALAEPLSQHPQVRHARQCGMIWAWDIATEDPHFAQRYHAKALEHGLLLRPIGNTLYFMPPYIVSESDCQHLVQGAVVTLNQVLSGSP
jgi:adenosylmethionine---8-amino-7-oxononanoate aminotransferase